MAKHTFVLPESMRHPDNIKPGCTYDLDRAFTTLETRLGTNDYVMGKSLTVPDIIITHCCGWADRSGYSITQPSIHQYLARCHQRAAYTRAMEVRNNYV